MEPCKWKNTKYCGHKRNKWICLCGSELTQECRDLFSRVPLCDLPREVGTARFAHTLMHHVTGILPQLHIRHEQTHTYTHIQYMHISKVTHADHCRIARLDYTALFLDTHYHTRPDGQETQSEGHLLPCVWLKERNGSCTMLPFGVMIYIVKL